VSDCALLSKLGLPWTCRTCLVRGSATTDWLKLALATTLATCCACTFLVVLRFLVLHCLHWCMDDDDAARMRMRQLIEADNTCLTRTNSTNTCTALVIKSEQHQGDVELHPSSDDERIPSRRTEYPVELLHGRGPRKTSASSSGGTEEPDGRVPAPLPQGVVRQAGTIGAQPDSSSSSTLWVELAKELSQRLKALDALKAAGVITEEEYIYKRKSVLDNAL